MYNHQVLLNASKCSGRGVKFRQLTADEADSCLLDAAKIAGQNATGLEIKKLEWRLGVRAMIVEVTVDKGLKDESQLQTAQWKKVDRVWLDQNFSELFNVKDGKILESLYRQFHEVNDEEIEQIAGKALPVSAD